MKNVFKMSGIIFLMAALCFAYVSCDKDESIGSEVNVSGNTLAQKIEWVQSHRSSGTTYTIEVTADEEISGYMFTSGSNRNMTIILNGNGKTIFLKNDAIRWLFMVGDNITLELNNITLKGHDNNRASLVMVIGGLVMNDGSKIIDNKIITVSGGAKGGGVWVRPHGNFTMNRGVIYGNNVSSGSGGGVYVDNYGTFTINDGEISGNTAGEGSGVHSDGTFTMNGGKIYGNTATFRGGGVNVKGVFRITNGTIYGSNAADELKNTAYSGAALSTWSVSNAQYGTFNGDTWISNGNLSSTNNTIKVVNGVLQ